MVAKSSVTTNALHAKAYLQSKGWTSAQASGLVGNFQQESGVNLNTAASGDSGQAYGIAQWHPDRQANFQKQYGFPIQQASLDQQLDFVNWELNNTEKAAGDKLRAATTPSQAALVVSSSYERAGLPNNYNRIAYANAVNDGPAPTPSTVPPLTPAEQGKIEGAPEGEVPPPRPGTEYATDPETGRQYRISPPGIPAEQGTEPTIQQPDTIDLSQPLPNLLHQFPSYIYGLSLHLLNATEYNDVVNGGNYVPNRVLVASAGRYNNTPGLTQFIRSPYFSEDFYFDNFNMTTVIGTNSHSRNTNAIEMSFTLIEPYGMTLINRLLDQANDPEMNCSNYLEMVYMLQIDFFASDDAGEIVGVVPGITKRIPIKLTQMNISTNTGGSKYEIMAVPYNHTAYDQTTISTPANFEVVAGSVGEFFQAGSTTNPQNQVRSFPSALNGWHGDLAKNNKIGVPDTYSFNVDPKIANSSFVNASTLSPRDTSMVNPLNTASIRQSNLGNATKDYNPQTRTFSINAGTSIDKVIDNVVRNSDYIQNQIAIPDGVDPQTYLQQKAQNANQPLNWYKITPTVNLGPFDPVRKMYSRNITYNVKPYVIYNVKSDVAPQGKISTFAKEYNYIYTGQNDDIIDFDINFNTLYYTAQTAYRNSLSNIYKVPDSSAENSNTKNTDSYQGANQQPNSVMPMVMKPQVYNAKARATGGSNSAKAVAVADLEDSLMTTSAADMLSVQLKILGDPQFIKQDDAFYSAMAPIQTSTTDSRLTPNGSLRTDYQEVYVKLTFRTPVDLDESTGLMDFGQNYKTSVFSGVYRVLTVISEFRAGEFTQTLDLIRLPYQPTYDYAKQAPSSSSQRLSDISPRTTPALSLPPNVQNIVAAPTIPEANDLGITGRLQAVLPEEFVSPNQQQLINLTNKIPTRPISGATEPVAVPYIPGH